MTLVRWKRAIPSSLYTRRLSGRRNRFRIRVRRRNGVRRLFPEPRPFLARWLRHPMEESVPYLE